MVNRVIVAIFGLTIIACDKGAPPSNGPAPPSERGSGLSPDVNKPASTIPADVTASAPSPSSSTSTAPLPFKAVAFPGATAPVSLDYLACERAASRVWVPVGDTGSVDVLDIATGGFTRVDGFATAEREMRGKKRIAGPSSVSIGNGYAYVGNRATSEVCAVDSKTLKLAHCLKLPTPPDGVAYVASAKEVWVTTPRDQSLTILDASKPDTLSPKAVIKLDGQPEGYGVDEGRGLFFTNLEDKGGTLAIDVKTRKVKSTWSPGCSSDGPRGLAVDAARGFIVVACTDHLQVLDGGHDGAMLGKADTGAGVDNIDYADTKQWIVAVAGKAARLTFAHLDDKGQLTVVATAPTADGTRNVVADANGNAYVADAQGARLLLVAAPALAR